MDITSVLKKKTQDDPVDEEIRMERAEELHSESLVIDGHQGTLLDVIKGVRDFGDESSTGHSDLPRLRREGRLRCSKRIPLRQVNAYPRHKAGA